MTTTPTIGTTQTVALSAINVREGFNPRHEFDAKALAALTHSIERRGLLQPLLVAPGQTDGEYELVAGERRYAACCELGLMEIPVHIRARDEQGDRLADAVAENFHREQLNPLEQAQAFARLIEHGLTRKGVAEELCVSQKLVTDRLAILGLAQELHPLIANETIPTSAVKALNTLAKLHPGLPSLAVEHATTRPNPDRGIYEEELPTWADIARDPVGAVIPAWGDEDRLPHGVYVPQRDYAVSAFSLTDKATRVLGELSKHGDVTDEQVTVRFMLEEVAAAEALGAVARSADGHRVLIVGQEVCDQLASDALLARAKHVKAHHKQMAEYRDAHGPAENDAVAAAPTAVTDEEREAQRKVQRDAERQAGVDAHAHNVALGTGVLKAMARLKADHDSVRVLSAYSVSEQLDAIALRGARYCLPGWFTETTQKNGRVKVDYLDRGQAQAKAREFLDGAKTAEDVCGRVISLLVLAHYAQEEAVARSNRSLYTLTAPGTSSYPYADAPRSGVPWGGKARGLLEAMAEERLPEQLTAAVRQAREQHDAERAEADRAEAQRTAASEQLSEQAPRLSAQDRAERRDALVEQYGFLGRELGHKLDALDQADVDEPQATPATAD